MKKFSQKIREELRNMEQGFRKSLSIALVTAMVAGNIFSSFSVDTRAEEVDAEYKTSYADDADYIPDETVYQYQNTSHQFNFYGFGGGLFNLRSESGRMINAFCIDFNTGTHQNINYNARPISQAGNYAEPYVDYLSLKDGVSIKDRLKTIVNNVNKNDSESVRAAQILIWHTIHGGSIYKSNRQKTNQMGDFSGYGWLKNYSYATFPGEGVPEKPLPQNMLWARENGNAAGRELLGNERGNNGQCKIKIKDAKSKLGHEPVVTVYKSKIDIKTGTVISKEYAKDAVSGEVLKGKTYHSDIEMYLEPYDKADYKAVKYGRYSNGRYYYEEKREYTTYNSYDVYVDGILVSRKINQGRFYSEPLVFKDKNNRLQNNWYYEYVLRNNYTKAGHSIEGRALSEYNRLKDLANKAQPGYDGDIKAKFNFDDVKLTKKDNNLELTYNLKVSSDQKLKYSDLPELKYVIPGHNGDIQLNTIGSPTVEKKGDASWSVKANVDCTGLHEQEEYNIRIIAEVKVENLTEGQRKAVFALISNPSGKQNLISTDEMENKGSLKAQVDVKIGKNVNLTNLTIDKTWENDLDIKNSRNLTLIIKRSIAGGNEETFAEVKPVLGQEKAENANGVSFKVKAASVGENAWKIEIKELPKLDSNGKEYKYSIVEKATPEVSKYITEDMKADTKDNINFKLVNKAAYSLDVYINKVGVLASAGTLTGSVQNEIGAIGGASFELSYNAAKAGDYVKIRDLTVSEDSKNNVFKDLKEGYYSLKETKAPDNYELNSDPILFEVKAENGKAVLKIDDSYKDTKPNTVKARNKVKEISISVEKIWNADDNNKSDITIQLVDKNTREVKQVRVFSKKDNIWKHKFDNLPILDKNGRPIEYDVIELEEKNGIAKIGANEYKVSTSRSEDGKSFTITNTVIGKIKLTVNKKFIGAKTDKTYVGVFKADELIDVLTIDNSKGSSVSQEYDRFDKDHKELVYTVKELDIIKDNLDESIKNANTGYKTVLFGGINYKILENKNYIVDNKQSYQADYSKDSGSDTYNITNTEVFKIGVRKLWKNDKSSHNPVEIGVYDGETLKERLTVVGSETKYTDWLPKYRDNNELINYTIKEISGTETAADNGIIVIGNNKYKVSVEKSSDNGSTTLYTVTNTLKNGVVVNVDKQWVGNSKKQKITAYLYIKDTTNDKLQYTGKFEELTESNGYKAIFEKLDELNSNQIYVVREEADLNGHTDINNKEIKLSGTAYDVNYKDEQKNSKYTTTIANGEKTKIQVDKVWIGKVADNAEVKLGVYEDGKFSASDRHDIITLNKLSKTEKTQDGKTIWSAYSNKELPKYDSRGTEIRYVVRELDANDTIKDTGSVTEISDRHYRVEYKDNKAVNTEVIKIKADKVWIGEAPDGKVILNVYNSKGDKVDSITIAKDTTTGNKSLWRGTSTKWLDAGDTYTVKEASGQGEFKAGEIVAIGENSYRVKELKYSDGSIIAVNEQLITVKGIKRFKGAVPTDGIKVGLFTNDNGSLQRVPGIEPKTIHSNNEEFKFENLPAGHTYVVRELDKADNPIDNGKIAEIGADHRYKVEYSGEYDITNTRVGDVEISVTKKWVGTSAAAKIGVFKGNEATPVHIFNITGNGTQSIRLPKFDEKGQEITYVVKEMDGDNKAGDEIIIDGRRYSVGYSDNNTITNTEQRVDISVEKKWVNTGTAETTVVLMKNGQRVAGSEQKLTADKTRHTYTDNIKTENGKDIKYTVRELDAQGNLIDTDKDNILVGKDIFRVSYVDDEANYKTTITNTAPLKEVEVLKKWVGKDGSPANESDTEQIEVILYKKVGSDAEYVPTTHKAVLKSGNWSHKFTDLPAYENGKPVVYSAIEMIRGQALNNGKSLKMDNGDSYTANYDLSVTDKIVITNTVEPDNTTVDIPFLKRWNNLNGSKQPDSIKVRLLSRPVGEDMDFTEVTIGGVKQEKTVDANSGWKGVFKGLPLRDSNKRILEYKIEEVTVPGFAPVYDTEEINGVKTQVITNVSVPKLSKTDQKGRPAGGAKFELWKMIDDIIGKIGIPVHSNMAANPTQEGLNPVVETVADAKAVNVSEAKSNSYNMTISFALVGGNENIPVKAALVVNGEASGDEEMFTANRRIEMPVVLKDTDMIAAKFSYPSYINISKDNISFDKDSRTFTLTLPEDIENTAPKAAELKDDELNNAENAADTAIKAEDKNTDKVAEAENKGNKDNAEQAAPKDETQIDTGDVSARPSENEGAATNDTSADINVSENNADRAVPARDNVEEGTTPEASVISMIHSASAIGKVTDLISVISDSVPVSAILTEIEKAAKSVMEPQYEKIAEIVSDHNGAIDLDKLNLEDGEYYLVEVSAPTSRPEGAKEGDYWKAVDKSIKYEFIFDDGDIIPQSENIKDIYDAAGNLVGYRIENSFVEIPNDPPTPPTPPTPPEIPYIPPNTPEIPNDPPTPDTNIPEEPVTLTPPPVPDIVIPDSPIPLSDDDELFVADDDIPLDGIPKTGENDNHIMMLSMAGAAIGGLLFLRKKKKKNDA